MRDVSQERGARAIRADAVANRRRVEEAARAVLAERGFEFAMADVVVQSGLGAGTVYRNCGSREGLIYGVIGELNERISADLRDLRVRADVRDALADGIRAGYQLVADYGALVLALLSGGAPRRYQQAFAEERFRTAIDTLVRRGIANGGLPETLDADAAAAMVSAMFAPRTLTRLLRSRSPGQAADIAVQFFFGGLDRLAEAGTAHDASR